MISEVSFSFIIELFIFILETHSHTKSANNICMAGSGDVVLGATLMLGVIGTECKIGILVSVEV